MSPIAFATCKRLGSSQRDAAERAAQLRATWEHAALLLLSLGAVQDAKNTSVPLAEHMMLAQPEEHSRDTELFGETLKDYLWGNIEPVTSDGILVKGDRTLVDVLSHIIRDAFVFLKRSPTLFRLTISQALGGGFAASSVSMCLTVGQPICWTAP